MEHSEDDPSQDRKPSRLRVAAFVIVAVTFVTASIAVGLLTNHPEHAPSARLSDGRTITVHAVTYGTAHSVDKETGLVKKLRASLPNWATRFLPAKSTPIKIRTVNDQLAVWINLSDTKGFISSVGSFKIVSPSGQRFRTASVCPTSAWKDLPISGAIYAVFPRRSRFLTLTGTVDKLPFSVEFANPAFGIKRPTWNTTSLPATNMAGPYEVVLTGANIDPKGQTRQFYPYFKAYRDGKLLTYKFAYGFTLTDPTGNTALNIPLDEPAWRVNLSISRTDVDLLLANEVRDFIVTRVPAITNHVEVNIDQNINGQQIHRLWVGGPGDYEFENGSLISVKPRPGGGTITTETMSTMPGNRWQFNWGTTQHWAVCHAERPLANRAFSLFANDADGKPIKVTRPMRYSGDYGTILSCVLEVPAEESPTKRDSPRRSFEEYAKPPITIRLASHEKFQTEFFIDPRKLPGNSPSK